MIFVAVARRHCSLLLPLSSTREKPFTTRLPHPFFHSFSRQVFPCFPHASRCSELEKKTRFPTPILLPSKTSSSDDDALSGETETSHLFALRYSSFAPSPPLPFSPRATRSSLLHNHTKKL